MDAIDQKIIELLKKNAKLGMKELATMVGLTTTPTYERVRRLERSGIITGYTVQLNKKLMGMNLQVLCQVSLKEHNLGLLQKFEQKVVEFPEVIQCYHIAGDHDYILLIEVKDMDEYESFLRERLATIPSIGNVQSSFVMTTLKS